MSDVLFHVGGYEDFSLTLQTSVGGVSSTDDVSAASSIAVSVITRDNPSSEIVSITADSGFTGANWGNGLVTGAFLSVDTAGITSYGWHDIEVAVTIAGNVTFYRFEKAVKIVS